MKNKQFNILSSLLIAAVLRAGSAQAGIGIDYSDTQGWNASSAGTTSLYASVSASAGDVVVLSVADNKKNSVALVAGGWSGGTNGVLTDIETSGDTYPASYISYIEVEQAGTYDFWMECADPALTALSALYVLRPDAGETAFLAGTAEWIDPDNADNGTAYSLDYTFSDELTDGVLIEAISARTDLITEPVAYTEDNTGSDKRLLVSYDGVTGNSWTSAYTLASGDAGTQTSSGLGVIFSASADGDGGVGASPLTVVNQDGGSLAEAGSMVTGWDAAVGDILVFSAAVNKQVETIGFSVTSSDTGVVDTGVNVEVSSSGAGAKVEYFTVTAAGTFDVALINPGLALTTFGAFHLTGGVQDVVPADTVWPDGELSGSIVYNVMDASGFVIEAASTYSDSFTTYPLPFAAQNLATAPKRMALYGALTNETTLTRSYVVSTAEKTRAALAGFVFVAAETVGSPTLSNPTNTITDGTGDGFALIGETNDVAVLLENSGGGIVTNAVATLTAATNSDYFVITTNATPADLAGGEQTNNTFAVIARTNAVPGTYTFDVAVTADGGLGVTNTVQIEVVSGIAVGGQDLADTFYLVADSIGDVVTNMELTVTNDSFSPLVCTFSESATWLQNIPQLTVAPRSVSNVLLVADAAGLNFGSYTEPLNVAYSQNAGGAFTNFSVRLDVGAKLTFTGQTDMELTNSGLFADVYERGDVIEIVVNTKNDGESTVSNVVNSLTTDPLAFSIVPLTSTNYTVFAGGASTSTTYRVTVLPAATNGTYTFNVLNEGEYKGEQLNWPGIFTLDVVAQAVPGVSPGVINLDVDEGQIGSATITVTNSGNLPLSFSVSNTAAWDENYVVTTGVESPVATSMNIALNDPAPANPFVTADTEGVSASMPIGFSFPFYGTDYTRFYVTADGVIGLSNTNDTPALGNGLGSLPDGDGVPLVAPFWGSLSAPAGSITYSQEADVLAITWSGVDQVSTYGGSNLEFQALLYANGCVEFRYEEINGNWVDYVTVGLQSSATVFTNLNITPASGTSVQVCPEPDSWVSIAPTNGSVLAQSSVDVVVEANAEGRTVGDGIAFDALFSWDVGGSSSVGVTVNVTESAPIYQAVDTLAFSGPAGAVTTAPFIITNTGTASLDFTIVNTAAATAGVVSNNVDYSWIDISSIGTNITLIDPDPNPYITALDEGTSAQIPFGFSFPFFGGNFTEFSVSANGAIRLDGGTGRVRVMDSLASTDAAMPAQMIAPYWGDLVMDDDATLKVHASAERVVITWENVKQYGLQGGSNLTFQLVLRPSGEILFHYKQLEGYPWPYTLIGVRDTAARTVPVDIRQPGDATTNTYLYSGRVYTQYVDTVTERTAAFESAQIRVISATPSSGSVPAGGTAEITITGDASNLSAGSGSAVTNATFTITHNAVGSPDALVVTFTATNSQELVFASAAALDSDKDGITDDSERIAGTDPQNSESVFVVKTTAGRELSWTAAAGRTYTVWYTTSLNDPFVPLAENISAGSYIDSRNGEEPIVFYKVTVNVP